MALYHFSVRNVSRGKGQMVVASAAYISGQRIFDSYYNKIHDYTSKSGVIFTEILTPEYVPERLTDRETLWNEVEHVERNNKAQLAYSFDIALQNELTLEENIRLAKEFCQEQFVARGMIVDLAVMREKRKMKKNRIIPISMCLSQSVLLQRKESGAISREGNIFLMRMETG